MTLIPFLLSALSLHGTILLNGVNREVLLTDTRVDVGFQAFKIVESDGSQLKGSRLVISNNVRMSDQTIYIWLNTKCEDATQPDANAFIVIRDNLHAPYPIVGNCLKLEERQ